MSIGLAYMVFFLNRQCLNKSFSKVEHTMDYRKIDLRAKYEVVFERFPGKWPV